MTRSRGRSTRWPAHARSRRINSPVRAGPRADRLFVSNVVKCGLIVHPLEDSLVVEEIEFLKERKVPRKPYRFIDQREDHRKLIAFWLSDVNQTLQGRRQF